MKKILSLATGLLCFAAGGAHSGTFEQQAQELNQDISKNLSSMAAKPLDLESLLGDYRSDPSMSNADCAERIRIIRDGRETIRVAPLDAGALDQVRTFSGIGEDQGPYERTILTSQSLIHEVDRMVARGSAGRHGRTAVALEIEHHSLVKLYGGDRDLVETIDRTTDPETRETTTLVCSYQRPKA